MKGRDRMANTHPKVFISYAWEDDIKKRVQNLAQKLRSDGIEAMIDQWGVAPGDRLQQFMEISISTSDFVLIICTPKYKMKVEQREGGAGYEGDMISSEQYYNNNPRKFIPLLAKGEWQKAAPVFLRGKNYLDFRENIGMENYQVLLNTLFNNYPAPPPLGRIPRFSSKKKQKD